MSGTGLDDPVLEPPRWLKRLVAKLRRRPLEREPDVSTGVGAWRCSCLPPGIGGVARTAPGPWHHEGCLLRIGPVA